MRTWFRLLLALSLFLLAACICFGQSNLASISGVVTDPQSAVIPHATITATNVETGVQNSVPTNSAGFYKLQNLTIGVYNISVEHAGFRKYVREGITLATGQQLGLDVTLAVGPTGQSITITGEQPPIETRASEVSTLVESKSISALPLGNRRTLNVVQLSGAAVFVGYPNTPANVNPSFSIAGGRTQSQMAWIDGGNAQNARIGTPQINLDPPVEAIEEVKVLTSNYSAEYGASASGVVIETTKSGTNQLHGSATEFFRNNAMDAPGFFAPVANGEKVSPALRYNVFGATAGGPVRKDKTFFFFAYEGQRLRTSSSSTLTVPTALQRKGDFSQTFNNSGKLIPIYDPGTTQLVNGSYVRQPFANNAIPAGQIDPVALALLNYYPAPNQPAGNIAGANNFNGNPVTGTPSDFYMAKVDHNFREADRITGRYMRIAGTSSIASIYPNGGAGDPTNHAENWMRYVYANWSHVVNSAQVNDFRFTYNDRLFHNISAGLGGNYPSKLGLKGVPDDAFPTVAPAGFSGLGASQQERLETPIRTLQFVDNYSWNHGRHALKFGFEVRHTYHGDVLRSSVSGSFGFSTQPTSLPGNTTTGSGLASMLTGFVTGFSEVQTLPLFRRSYYLGGFAQDNWTISPNLTVNLGLRWETDTPMVDTANNRMNSFDLGQVNPVSGTPGVVKFLGVAGYPTTPYEADWNNFGPRFGFAWRPFHSEKTVVRGGYGIFFAHPFDGSVGNVTSLGFGVSSSLNTPDQGITAPFYLRSGVPVSPSASTLNDSFGTVPVGQSTTTSVTFFDRHRATGYSQQFNIGFQHDLAGGMMFEVMALGNLSRKLSNANLSMNQIQPQILGPQHSSQKDRPFPQFTDVAIQFPTIGVSNYYAGMVRIQKRYSRGLSFGVNYTWSKYLGNISTPGSSEGNGAGIYSNYYNRRADYGPTSNDIAHRMNFHWIYELPFGTGKRWLAQNPLRSIVGGWAIGNVATFQTGAANTVTTQTNNCNCFSAGAQRPNVIGNANVPSNQRTILTWFDTAAFAQPAAYTLGNSGTGIVRGPGLMNLDFSVLRNFPITERIHTEFRGEFFNAFNHTNLGNPGAVFGSSSFGVISLAGPARQIEVGVRVLF
jgi:Carboxypeptidase regulatory-like domain/TonB-dependent Receptor Plug Domain